MAEFKVRRGYGPEVGRRFIPSTYLSDVAGSIRAQGLENVARGAGDLASGLVELEEQKYLAKEREDGFAVNMALLDAENDAIISFNEDANKAELGAPGFTEAQRAKIKDASVRRLEELRASGISERAFQAAVRGFGELDNTYTQRAVAFQQDSRDAAARAAVDAAREKLGNNVLADPDQIEKVLDQLDAIIDTYPGTITAIEREKIRDAAADYLREIAGIAIAKQDPQRVVDAFMEYPEGTILDAMARGIAGVESSHTKDPYLAFGPLTDKGDRAWGKYQVMGENVGPWTERWLGRRFSIPEFRANPAAQEELFRKVMGSYLAKYGNINDAASMWFTGVPYAQAVKEGRDDTYLTVQQYVAKVRGYLTGKGTPTGDGGGDNILQHLTAEQRLKALNAAESELNKSRTDYRTSLEIDLRNAYAAHSVGKEYTGDEINLDRMLLAYDPEIAHQKWAEYQRSENVGQFIASFRTMPLDEINRKLKEFEPKDTSSDTYSVELESYAAAVDARDAIVKAREDPAAYITDENNYPEIAAAWKAMAEGQGVNDLPKEVYQMMWEAYEGLKIPIGDRNPFPDSAAEKMGEYLDGAGAPAVFNYIFDMKNNMPDEMFENGLSQLSKMGFPKEAFAAGLVVESPEHRITMLNALRGVRRLEDDSTLQINHGNFKNDFNEYLKDATLGLPPDIVQTVYELSLGLYVSKRGDVTTVDEGLFKGSIREVLGGWSEDDGTGVYDGSTGDAGFTTILPLGVNKDEFTSWVDNATDENYTDLGNGIPRNMNGDIITAEDIANDGVFVRVSKNTYQIYMGFDGGRVEIGNDVPYEIDLTKELMFPVPLPRPRPTMNKDVGPPSLSKSLQPGREVGKGTIKQVLEATIPDDWLPNVPFVPDMGTMIKQAAEAGDNLRTLIAAGAREFGSDTSEERYPREVLIRAMRNYLTEFSGDAELRKDVKDIMNGLLTNKVTTKQAKDALDHLIGKRKQPTKDGTRNQLY